jgi:hypothetical protein
MVNYLSPADAFCCGFTQKNANGARKTTCNPRLFAFCYLILHAHHRQA